MSEHNKSPGVGGCLILLVFFVLEPAAAFFVGVLAHMAIFAILSAVVPAGALKVANICAIILCLIPAGFTFWLLERLCARLTGRKVMEYIPDLAGFP